MGYNVFIFRRHNDRAETRCELSDGAIILPLFSMEPWTLVAVTSQAVCYDLLVQCEASALNKWLSEQFAEAT